MNTAQRLASQESASGVGQAIGSGNVRGRTLSIPCPVGKWTKLLDANPSRRLLEINNRGGESGPGSVGIALDSQDKSAIYHIDRFQPLIVPTNAIYAYVESAYGDVVVSVQLIEG